MCEKESMYHSLCLNSKENSQLTNIQAGCRAIITIKYADMIDMFVRTGKDCEIKINIDDIDN